MEQTRRERTGLRWLAAVAGTATALGMSGCAPLVPWSTDTPNLVLVPASQAGVQDKRGRFREIYCAVLEARRHLPDHRPCDEALTRVGTEPPGDGRPVPLAPSRRQLVAVVVPGIGWDCIAPWLEPQDTAREHLRSQGYDRAMLRVDALSGTQRNARQIRDALMAMDAPAGAPRLVLVGYSKGAPDIMEALAEYPEVRGRVAAFVSVAGAVGGSPLANAGEQWQAALMRYFPGATCDAGDGGGVEALRPGPRRAWLAARTLPPGIRYYSVVTYPAPERISLILQPTHQRLSSVDGRNDGQVIFYDQILPGSALAAYLNADHWAVAVPIGRTHWIVESLFVTHNAYPREALLEATLRFVEDDLDGRP